MTDNATILAKDKFQDTLWAFKITANSIIMNYFINPAFL